MAEHVLVTGANGYVASWVVKAFLEAGHHVRATVRNPDDRQKVGHLRALADSSAGSLTFYKADLFDATAFDEPMQGCSIVVHTASPFTTKVSNPQRDLIDPALQGTRNVLNAVERTPSVTRVVLTSSCAAIFSDNIECANAPEAGLNESHWNTSSSLEHNPYHYSKTLAEQAAWEMAEPQSRWRLVVLNPALVMGPGLNPNATSESFAIMGQLARGELRFGAPGIGAVVVDVRDLAEAHLRAATLPDMHGRYVISGSNTTILEISQSLEGEFGDRVKLPKRELPKWLVWLLAPAVGQTRKFISRNVGYRCAVDNTRSREALGMSYRSLNETTCDFFRQLLSPCDSAPDGQREGLLLPETAGVNQQADQ
ncbi:dihydroflavonol-4-reductase [Litorivivens lipolytica]|uniref:Dihydroflavonol-4-reductase n=1 Tax=Litorivivens lipolytica TaxID=1524264 RepID=A0A7W4Z465_9GAMM|nr:aldehyde reductase [Litorivivens lipolytica]MBB3045783.1 dihydroflavonol-4-reductase [Litorivivens lipolytica]